MRVCRALLIIGILGVGAIGFAVALRYPIALAVPVALALYLGGRKAVRLTSHGTARWADADDLRSAGMIGGTGLPLGRISSGRPRFWKSLADLFNPRVPARQACERFMVSMRKLQRVPEAHEVARLNNAVHTAVFAPTGAGKGVSIVIPFLQSCPDSCVVIDPKGENARLTARQRREMGHKVVILDPFKVVTQTPDSFNPLAMVDAASPTALDDLRAMAKELVIRTGTEPDPHWNDTAERLITAMMAATCAFMNDDSRSLQTVRTAITDEAERNEAIALMRRATQWDGMLARLGNEVSTYRDKELAGVLSTANRHMNFLDTLAVAASTKASTFDPAELRQRKVTVYLVLPPEYLKSQSALLRLWVGSLMRACVRGGARESNKVYFLLDEAASLGQMEVLEDAVDKYRGYGVRLVFIYQALGQLKACWREGKDQTLLANTSHVFFGTQEFATAEHVSNQLGEQTIIVHSGGSNTGGNLGRTTGAQHSTSVGESWGNSANWQQHGRRLLKPEEVINLDPRLAVTFCPGVRPILTRLLRYYEERPGSPWKRMQTTAEIWATALGMVALAAALFYLATNWRVS